MRNWIAGVMTVLGVLLVLGGGAVVALKALAATGGEATVDTSGPSRSSRFVAAMRRVQASDRLIGWGIVLLLLAAVAGGAISFNLGLSAVSK
jgi:hypothetical protein